MVLFLDCYCDDIKMTTPFDEMLIESTKLKQFLDEEIKKVADGTMKFSYDNEALNYVKALHLIKDYINNNEFKY